MADHDHGAWIALEPGFQPDQRVEVQVVGRLVEQQQVGRAHQRARQLQSHAPAAGETVDRLAKLRGTEAKAQDQRLGARHGIVFTGVGQGRCRRAPCACRRRWPQRRLLRPARPAVTVSPPSTKSVATLLGLRHVLRDLAHPPCAGIENSPPSSCSVPLRRPKKDRLAGAIAADKANLFAGGEGDGRAVEYDIDATAQRDITDGNHKGLLRRG